MEQLLKELSLYDLTGYLIPGIIVVWSVLFVMNAFLFRRKSDYIKPSTFAIVIVGYITGHMLQTIATFFEEHLFSIFRDSEFWQSTDQLYANDPPFRDALNSAIKAVFVSKDTLVNVAQHSQFVLCQTYVRVHGLDAYTDIMTARYAFFKGLTLALFISCCAFAVEAFWRRRMANRGRVFLMAVALLVATLLSYERLLRFEHYYVDGVYRTFYMGVMANTKPADTADTHTSQP